MHVNSLTSALIIPSETAVLSRSLKLTDVLTTLLPSASDLYVRDSIQRTGYYLRGTDESLDSGSTYSFASSQSTSDGNQAQIRSSHAGRYYHSSSNAQLNQFTPRPSYLNPQSINMNHCGRFSTSSSSSSLSTSSTRLSESSSRNRSHGCFMEYPRSVYIPLSPSFEYDG